MSLIRQPSKRPALALDVNVVQDNLPQEIFPHVFIGSIHAAFNQEALISLGVTHVRRFILILMILIITQY